MTFLAGIELVASDRPGLLAEMAKVISETGTNIRSSHMETEGDLAQGSFVLEICDTRHLERVIETLKLVDGVLTVRRSFRPTSF